jgi:hypothetical protein
LKVLCLACIPDSNIYLFDAHLKIVLAAVVDFAISGCNTRLARVILEPQMYLLQCWQGRFAHVPFKELLLDIYEFLAQVRYHNFTPLSL